jgi:hypothetical protein
MTADGGGGGLKSNKTTAKNCRLLPTQPLFGGESHKQLISNAGWSKLDFAERDQCKPVLLRLSLARFTRFVPLWDQTEGARLPISNTGR